MLAAMLQAALHRKLDDSLAEPQRLEDALTSTAFGTLVMVEAAGVLGRWLGDGPARRVEGAWFWPRLAEAEPDVLVRLDGVLYAVEAKYRSGRHDRAAGEDGQDEKEGDQLVRQFNSLTLPPGRRPPYAADLERALAECRLVQVFMVDATKQRRARREFDESSKKLKGAALTLRNWQSLYRLLTVEASAARWAKDLLGYLDLVEVACFTGVRGRVRQVDSVVKSWRPAARSRASLGLRAVFGALPPRGVLLSWGTRPALRAKASDARLRLAVTPIARIGLDLARRALRRLDNLDIPRSPKE